MCNSKTSMKVYTILDMAPVIGVSRSMALEDFSNSEQLRKYLSRDLAS